MSEAIDLDVLLPDSKPVTLGGVQYQIPGDMPLVTFLKVNEVNVKQGEDDADPAALLGEMIECLVELFAWHIPEDDAATREQIRVQLKRRDMSFVAQLLSTLYPKDAEDLEEVPEDADGPPTATTGTTTPPAPPESPSAS